ncbi:MAG: zinc ABC transporter substrate-binding protein [Acidimicrobiaceae bacterium]|nr:zinc ABC transporter substrate-binding protein [Acidimicrobiaceae bacterium]
MDTFPYSFQGAHEGHDHDDEAHEDDHEGHDHDDEAHEDDHEGHDHSGDDPHVWFDPHRVSEALPALAQALKTSAGLDPAAVDACLASYQAELDAVDAEIAAMVEQVPAESRKLVTNHEALAYFADRYGFEVIGTVIPTPASMAQASPAQLEELAEIIEHEGVKALFAETVHSTDDVEALASRVGDVEVVTLYTGSLGPPGSGADTYIGFLRTNTELIVDALD